MWKRINRIFQPEILFTSLCSTPPPLPQVSYNFYFPLLLVVVCPAFFLFSRNLWSKWPPPNTAIKQDVFLLSNIHKVIRFIHLLMNHTCRLYSIAIAILYMNLNNIICKHIHTHKHIYLQLSENVYIDMYMCMELKKYSTDGIGRMRHRRWLYFQNITNNVMSVLYVCIG